MSSPRPVTYKVASILAVLYGLVSITFGVLGYTSKGSIASIVAGGVAGLLLLLSSAMIFRKPIWGLVAAAVVSIALLGRFVPGVVKMESGQSMSDLAMTTAITMTAGGVLVLLSSALALGGRSSGG